VDPECHLDAPRHRGIRVALEARSFRAGFRFQGLNFGVEDDHCDAHVRGMRRNTVLACTENRMAADRNPTIASQPVPARSPGTRCADITKSSDPAATAVFSNRASTPRRPAFCYHDLGYLRLRHSFASRLAMRGGETSPEKSVPDGIRRLGVGCRKLNRDATLPRTRWK